MKKLIYLIVVFLLVFSTFTGCKPKAEEEILIGVAEPYSGGYAAFGEETKAGRRLAVEEINASGGVLGVKIRLIEEDHEGSPEKTALVYKKLIDEDKVNMICGSFFSKCTLAGGPIAQERGIPNITISTNPKVTLVGDYIFRITYEDSFAGSIAAIYAYKNMGARKAAVLFDNSSDYNKGLAEYFKAKFIELQGEVVAYEAFTDELATTDYKAQLVSIKAKKPDVLFLPNSYGSDALVAKQARGLGLNVPFLGGDTWDDPQVVVLGGNYVEGAAFVTHFSKDDPDSFVQNFIKKYQEKYGKIPGTWAALAYDEIHVLADAVKRAGTYKDGAKIRDALKDTNLRVVTGTIKYDANRNPIKKAVILKIKNGKFVFDTEVIP